MDSNFNISTINKNINVSWKLSRFHILIKIMILNIYLERGLPMLAQFYERDLYFFFFIFGSCESLSRDESSNRRMSLLKSSYVNKSKWNIASSRMSCEDEWWDMGQDSDSSLRINGFWKPAMVNAEDQVTLRVWLNANYAWLVVLCPKITAVYFVKLSWVVRTPVVFLC